IGRQWATLADDEGNRRLDNPDDFVRFEVQAALERGVRVIPVLVDGARPLRRQELPAELHKLARLNALEWSSRRYQYDADQLLDLIQKVLAPIREREEADRQAREEAHRKAQEEEAERLAQEETDRMAREMGPAVSEAKLLRRDSDRLDAAQARADKATTTLRISEATLLQSRQEAQTAIRDGQQIPGPGSKIGQAIADQPSRAVHDSPEAARASRSRRAGLLRDAVRVAYSIDKGYLKGPLLADLALVIAATDADYAERVARLIPSEDTKDTALVSLAQALAVTDPDRGERIVRSITDRYNNGKQAPALARLAQATVATDPRPRPAVCHRR